MTLLADELVRTIKDSSSDFTKHFKSLNKTLIEGSIFSWSSTENLKSLTKLKYLHIGFKLVSEILGKLSKECQSKKKSRRDVIKEVLTDLLLKNSNFRDVLIKNVQMPKNTLHDIAKEVKGHVVSLLEKLKAPAEERGDQFFLDLLH